MPQNAFYSPDIVENHQYIHINQCGILPCKDKSANVIRPNGRNDYLLLYVLKGVCVLNHTSDNPTTVEKGNIIIYKPGKPQYYFFPKDKDSVQIYIHFSGYGCEELFKSADIKKSIIKPHHTNELEYYLQKICELFDPDNNCSALQCNGLLIACFGLLAIRKNNEHEYLTKKNHKQISYIIGKIQTEPQLKYSVEEWARQCNISTPQFISVFKTATGCSPYQYLTKNRISYAKELLIFTDYCISEVARLCGYEDQNYFARLFKKATGSSPSEFKKRKM